MSHCIIWLLLAVVQVASALKPVTDIKNISQCKFGLDKEEVPDQSSRICLNVTFSESDNLTVGTVYITCKAYVKDRASPSWMDGFGLDTPSSGSCDATQVGFLQEPCLVWINDYSDNKHGKGEVPLCSNSKYFVFCSGIDINGSDSSGLPAGMAPLHVVPHCTSGKTCGLNVSTEREDYRSPEFSSTLVAACFLLLIYIFYSYLFLHFVWIRFLHETGFSVLAGLGVGFLIKAAYGEYVEFDYEVFSLIVLPLVIFSAGYNLPKSTFFRYILYIAGLGVCGTFWVFIFIYFESAIGGWKTYADEAFELTPKDRLILSSVLASTDSVAPMAFLPGALYPEIFAVVFGEGVFNDVVAILLSSAASNASSGLDSATVIKVLVQIVYLLVTSSAMGLAFGLGTSLIFKYVPRLSHEDEVLKPAAVMFLMNYVCYVITELLEFSSIFALFVCAVLCGHYAAASMNHHARDLMSEGSELLSYTAEAFVFGYFGLTAIPFIEEGAFAPAFIAYCIAAIFAARILAVCFVLVGLRVLRCGHRLSLACNEFAIIGFAGCMRGTIAYALILKNVPSQSLLNTNQKVLVSTVLGIVLVNCLVFGGLFPVMLCLFRIKPKSGALLPTTGRNLLLRAQTRGLLPEGHPLRPDNLREHVRSRWAQFDENRMQQWFTRQEDEQREGHAPHHNFSTHGGVSLGGQEGELSSSVHFQSQPSRLSADGPPARSALRSSECPSERPVIGVSFDATQPTPQ